MKLTTRLLVILLPTAVAVMLVYAVWALLEREQTEVPKAELETRAFATALSVVLGDAFPDVEQSDLQGIINQAGQDPRVYAVILYGRDGQVRFVSHPLTRPGQAPDVFLAAAFQGKTVSFQREIQDQTVLSVMRPILNADRRVVAALEVSQPLSFLEAEQARVRRRFLLNTITLVVALSLVTLVLVRRIIGRPLDQMVEAARALGRGEFTHRIPEEPRGGELSQLAREFNTMTANLAAARSDLLREAEGRVALERRLHQSEKMAVVGNLAAGLAHQIAAPLNVISGRAEMLLRNEGAPAGRERNLQVILGQIGRITAIVRHLLDFARRPEPRLVPTDLVPLVDGVLELLEPEFQRLGIRARREGVPVLTTSADPDLLHQVLVNLVLNATQALEETEGPRDLVVRLEQGDDIRIEVQDSGPGIPEPVRARVFEPFFTTKAQGTGLGLLIVQSIVEAHGGTVDIPRSEPGAGTRFRIRLPQPMPQPVASHA